jgi:hypothetical protein
MSASATPASLLTRRAWAALFGTASLLAQQSSKAPPSAAPAPPPAELSPQQKMEKAIADVRRVSDRLAQMDVPMDVEPAFNFRA